MHFPQFPKERGHFCPQQDAMFQNARSIESSQKMEAAADRNVRAPGLLRQALAGNNIYGLYNISHVSGGIP